MQTVCYGESPKKMESRFLVQEQCWKCNVCCAGAKLSYRQWFFQIKLKQKPDFIGLSKMGWRSEE